MDNLLALADHPAAAVGYAKMDTAKNRRPEGLPANFTLEGQVMREMNV